MLPACGWSIRSFDATSSPLYLCLLPGCEMPEVVRVEIPETPPIAAVTHGNYRIYHFDDGSSVRVFSRRSLDASLADAAADLVETFGDVLSSGSATIPRSLCRLLARWFAICSTCEGLHASAGRQWTRARGATGGCAGGGGSASDWVVFARFGAVLGSSFAGGCPRKRQGMVGLVQMYPATVGLMVLGLALYGSLHGRLIVHCGGA